MLPGMLYCPGCQEIVQGVAPMGECPACGRDAPTRGWPDDPLLGTTISGRYRLESRLGAGGMGVVYRARDRAGRALAVKILHAYLSTSDDMLRRFRREARAAARLRGPHAVRVFESGELPDGSLFIAMELVGGESISRRLIRTGWIEAGEGLELLAQLADGLAEAHAAGLVHRDLKPDNLLIEPAEDAAGFRARILDFGIVKHLDAAQGTVGQTVTGRVFGTPEFMSPEQARGDPDLDHRSDIFSLGICAFLWWTGRLPWEGPNPQAVMLSRLTTDAPPLSEARPGRHFSPAVDALVARMLARSTADRIPSMEAVAAAARAAARQLVEPADSTATRPVEATPEPRRPPTPLRLEPSVTRRLGRVGGYVLLVGAFLAAMWGVAWLLAPS